jgi:hypothetical protein
LAASTGAFIFAKIGSSPPDLNLAPQRPDAVGGDEERFRGVKHGALGK